MRIRLIGLAFALVGATVSSGWAQSMRGWTVQWEQLRMDVSGADAHVGDVTRIARQATLASAPQITDKITHEPIGLGMRAANAFRAQGEYRAERWGWGASGWAQRTKDSVSGRVTSAGESRTPTLYTAQMSTVLMWNELLTPVRNDLEESGLSPVSYDASGRLRAYSADGYGLFNVASSDASRFDVLFGMKGARVEVNQDQAMRQRAFVQNAFRPFSFNNDITLTSTGESTVTGAGPLVGLTGRGRWRRVTVEGSLTQALLATSVTQSGAFADVDDVKLAQSSSGPFLTCPIELAGGGCYAVRSDWTFANEQKVLIPVTEARVAVLFDVTRHVAVGATTFGSIWTSVPAPPSFTMSHSDAGPGLDWDLAEQTLRFGSAGLVVRVGF